MPPIVGTNHAAQWPKGLISEGPLRYAVSMDVQAQRIGQEMGGADGEEDVGEEYLLLLTYVTAPSFTHAERLGAGE